MTSENKNLPKASLITMITMLLPCPALAITKSCHFSYR